MVWQEKMSKITYIAHSTVLHDTSCPDKCFINLINRETMGHEAIKLELIQWLANLEDDETLDYLKVLKDSNDTQKDWWHDLTDEQKSGIARGLKDVDEGRVRSHNDIKIQYGLCYQSEAISGV
jgi:hypothetical protein